jgi:hypothetical protein
MFTIVLLLGATCLHQPSEQKDKTIEMDLAGVRPAKAFLTVGKDEYLIRVVMTPITVFDKATNDLCNYEKARELALIALAKHLSGKDAAELTVSGAETVKSGEEEKKYSLTLRVPIMGVSLVKATEKKGNDEPAKATERIILNSSFFARKSDYQTIIKRLDKLLLAELKKVEDEKEEDKFDIAVKQMKKKGLDNFEKIERAVAADLLLFSMEQAELKQSVATQRQSFLAKLDEAIKQHKENDKEE